MTSKKYDWRDPDVVVLLTRDDVREYLVSQKSIILNKDGQLDEETFEELQEEILGNTWEFMADCCSTVEHRREREARNEDADKSSLHYGVYWKNENAYRPDYALVGIYKNLEDAREYVHDQVKTQDDLYKIVEVKDGKENQVGIYSPATSNVHYVL